MWMWSTLQGNLKNLKSIRHKFTRETWEASLCIACLYCCKSFSHCPEGYIHPQNKKMRFTRPSVPRRSQFTSQAVWSTIFCNLEEEEMVYSASLFVNCWSRYRFCNQKMFENRMELKGMERNGKERKTSPGELEITRPNIYFSVVQCVWDTICGSFSCSSKSSAQPRPHKHLKTYLPL